MSFPFCLFLTCRCVLFLFPTTIDGTNTLNTLLIMLSHNHHLTSPHLTHLSTCHPLLSSTIYDCLAQALSVFRRYCLAQHCLPIDRCKSMQSLTTHRRAGTTFDWTHHADMITAHVQTFD